MTANKILSSQSYKSQLIGYARVSSSGQNLDVQLAKLGGYGCDKIYKEKLSGLDQNRPELAKCLDYVREHDTLVVTRLDRVARSALHLGQIVELLEEKKVNFVVIDQNIDTKTPQGKLMFQMLASFAEFEQSLRKERQMDGIKQAKKNGVKFGRPSTLTREKANAVLEDMGTDLSVQAIMDKHAISRRSYYAIKTGKYKEKLC
jgi:DNA invertase Pin-like site-specific DNA recombinase